MAARRRLNASAEEDWEIGDVPCVEVAEDILPLKSRRHEDKKRKLAMNRGCAKPCIRAAANV